VCGREPIRAFRPDSTVPKTPNFKHDAKESNLPSEGLPRPAGFEVHPSETESPRLLGIR
jgi:hypothetical protein